MNSVRWNAAISLEDFFEIVNTQAYAAREYWKSSNNALARQVRNSAGIPKRYPMQSRYPLQAEGNARLPPSLTLKGKPHFSKLVSSYNAPGFQSMATRERPARTSPTNGLQFQSATREVAKTSNVIEKSPPRRYHDSFTSLEALEYISFRLQNILHILPSILKRQIQNVAEVRHDDDELSIRK